MATPDAAMFRRYLPLRRSADIRLSPLILRLRDDAFRSPMQAMRAPRRLRRVVSDSWLTRTARGAYDERWRRHGAGVAITIAAACLIFCQRFAIIFDMLARYALICVVLLYAFASAAAAYGFSPTLFTLFHRKGPKKKKLREALRAFSPAYASFAAPLAATRDAFERSSLRRRHSAMPLAAAMTFFIHACLYAQRRLPAACALPACPRSRERRHADALLTPR